MQNAATSTALHTNYNIYVIKKKKYYKTYKN